MSQSQAGVLQAVAGLVLLGLFVLYLVRTRKTQRPTSRPRPSGVDYVVIAVFVLLIVVGFAGHTIKP